MDGSYIKLDMEDYRKEKGFVVPPDKKTPTSASTSNSKSQTQPFNLDVFESVLEYDISEEVPADKPEWDGSSSRRSYKMSLEELEERRRQRTSKHLAAAQLELRKKSSRGSPRTDFSSRSKRGNPTTVATLQQKKSPNPSRSFVKREDYFFGHTKSSLNPKLRYDYKIPRKLPFSAENTVSEELLLHSPSPSLASDSTPSHSGSGCVVGTVSNFKPLHCTKTIITKKERKGKEKEDQDQDKDKESPAELAKSVKELQERLETMKKEYKELKEEFNAQKMTIEAVKEERDKNQRTVKDLSQILANNQEAQISMVSLIQTMQGKLGMLEQFGLVDNSSLSINKSKSKKVSFKLASKEILNPNPLLSTAKLDPSIAKMKMNASRHPRSKPTASTIDHQ